MFVSLFKELNLASLSKKLLKKVLFVLLLASSSIAQALTLGDFVVDSFLDKPLKAEITVNGNSGDNLNTLEISMASEEEFKQAGIVRASALENFNFKLVKDSKSTAKILVTTEDEVSDPYIHILLKIRWNGGQLLREFTALIDPPLYSSQPADKVDAAKTTKQKEVDLRKELKSVDEANNTASSNTSEPAQESTSSVGSLSGGTYGPVQAGESLSKVAELIQKDNPDLSIYQIMYVLFQNNQSAFVDQNINGLAKGSTLQVGDLSAITQVDKQEGINFFYSQLAQWSAKQESRSGASSDEVKISSSSEGQSSSDDSANSSEAAQDQSQASSDSSQASTEGGGDSESKPEFQVAASDVQSGAQQSGEVNNQVVTDLKNQISELQASVESSKLESEELKETIAILESQLADSNRLIELNNQELASLAENSNKESQNEALVATTVEEKPVEEAEVVEEEKPVESEQAVTEEPTTAEKPANAEEPATVEETKVEESKPEPEPKVEAEPAPIAAAPEQAPISFLDTIINTIKDLWKFIAIGLVGILGLIFLKMRSSKNEDDGIDAFESTFTVYPENTDDMPDEGENTSDAKAEELINAIKAETTKPASDAIANSAAIEEEVSGETSVVSSIDMDALREATQSVTDFEVDSAETGEVTKESSFLTVYNDGDVVVNADEIDPIAEADVYIAYGREDQGEEVLLDGVKNFPDRNDIKIALLGIYAKSGKREKFDDIYQGLVNAGIENNIEEWQSVEELKNTINAKTGGSTPDGLETSLSSLSDTVSGNNLGLDDEASNTDFIVNSDVDDLSEIDIKSESFDISEIDFSTEIGNAPVLNKEAEINVDNIALSDEITLDLDLDLDIETDVDVAGEIDSDTLEIESITIQVDSPEILESGEAEVAEELNDIVDSLDDVDFTTGAESDNNDISAIEKEMSQIDFADDSGLIGSEHSLQIDIDSPTANDTDEVDISAEISEISYNDEVSLTDVMELNVTDIDLASIPDDQDLTSVKDTAATTLVNDEDVDFIDDITIDEEVTVDLTEAMDFNDDGAAFGNIDLDLGESLDSSDGELPDGNSDPETQLDLAKVFLELDDVPGAVKILKELVDNGKVGEEAKELLAKHS